LESSCRAFGGSTRALEAEAEGGPIASASCVFNPDQRGSAEELVTELGAAFLCADLKVSQEPRADHAAHIANWLQVLKSDTEAIFVAASQSGFQGRRISAWLAAAHTWR